MKRRVREEDEVGELNIIPYLDIVTNLVMFMLLSMTGLITLGILNVDTPKIGGAEAQAASPDQSGPKLMLTIAITDRGFFVAGTGGVIEGTAETTTGFDSSKPPTLPKRNNEYDYAGLTRMLSVIKERFPNEKSAILVAEMSIPYEVIIQTMDASREQIVKEGEVSQRKPLFPQISLSSMVQ